MAAEIVKLSPFELLRDSNPNTGIPTVTWRIRDEEDPGYTLSDLAPGHRVHDQARIRRVRPPVGTMIGADGRR